MTAAWAGVDNGREGFWREPTWTKVLEILSRHQGEDYTDQTAPLYDELEADLPGNSWKGNFDRDRNFARGYADPWTKTGVVERQGTTLLVTSLGQAVLAGTATKRDVLVGLMRTHTEGTEHPFRILADALLQSRRDLSLIELYHGVMLGYRAWEGELEDFIRSIPSTPGMEDTPKRRLRHMLSLLEETGAVVEESGNYRAGDASVLADIVDLDALLRGFCHSLSEAAYEVSEETVRRFVAALLSKRFLILTGLSGSGKTRLAQSFAHWISRDDSYYEVVPVGPDWTSNEHILGYPDALDPRRYVRQRALDLMLRAESDPERVYVLLLDEMNLSHVERYFADLLSAIESEEPIPLYSLKDGEPKRDGVPRSIKVPRNLFIIGTVNVDETTYMFSSKVLDRANVIEFRAERDAVVKNLGNASRFDIAKLDAVGEGFSRRFVSEAASAAQLDANLLGMLQEEVGLFFDCLRAHGAEFGFRTAQEMARFIHFHSILERPGTPSFVGSMDAQIVQKLLPKLFGSRSKIEPLLCALATICYEKRTWTAQKMDNRAGLLKSAEGSAAEAQLFGDTQRRAIELGVPQEEPQGSGEGEIPAAEYPISFEKLCRMLTLLRLNGFVSFAEA